MKSADKREKRITYIVFAVYLLLLCWLVLFKFAVSAEDIQSLRSLNLTPFYYDGESSFHLREVLFNVLVFIPAGFYFSAMIPKMNVIFAPAAAAALSLLFEVLQWVFSLGASDITDVITNTVGGIYGMLLFVMLGRLVGGQRRMKIVNTLGIICEAFGLLLITLLIIVNRG